MFLLTLLSGVLFVLPIAVTIGITFVLESQRIFQAKGGPSRLETETYCQKQYGVTPYPGRYICECLRFEFSPRGAKTSALGAYIICWAGSGNFAKQPLRNRTNERFFLSQPQSMGRSRQHWESMYERKPFLSLNSSFLIHLPFSCPCGGNATASMLWLGMFHPTLA